MDSYTTIDKCARLVLSSLEQGKDWMERHCPQAKAELEGTVKRG